MIGISLTNHETLSPILGIFFFFIFYVSIIGAIGSGLTFWIRMIYLEGIMKNTFHLIITIFTGILGAIVFYIAVYKKKLS
ncbi:MAG: hypothetical protein Q8P57_03120 [Candidatus Pacearchaeota archaeon]|nr:hypothetical protein [Candidatus Pacearchaeota archaeon]